MALVSSDGAMDWLCVPASTGQPSTPSSVTLVMAVAHREPLVNVHPAAAWDLLARDEARWRAWTAQIDESVPFRDAAVRSQLTLRLLPYSPLRAPVAAHAFATAMSA